MRKDEVIAIKMMKNYKSITNSDDYVLVEADFMFSYAQLKFMWSHARKHKMKSFHIKNITPISDNSIVPMVWTPRIPKYDRSKMVHYEDMTGIFNLEMSDGSTVMFSAIVSGAGANKRIDRFIASDKNTMYKFVKYLNKTKRFNNKPKNGLFTVMMSQHEILYSPIEKKQSVRVIHDAVNTINMDLDFFFNNTELFTRYGMPGTRKIMMVGPPGTGKTSLCIELGLKHKDSMPVCIAQDIGSLAKHLQACAKYKMPTIIIVEDAESLLNDMGVGTSSMLLNFLDGVNQPTNPHGAYVIMTTNHPDRIEPRILKRPGRIDKIVSVGPLAGKQAKQCAKIYFGAEYQWVRKADFDNMTGAQIRELAQSCFAYAAQNGLTVNDALVETVREKLTDDISDAYKYAEDNTLAGHALKVGF
jgi:SpoVK/Ycf46/Vps4 family AAA+-type ATPase